MQKIRGVLKNLIASPTLLALESRVKTSGNEILASCHILLEMNVSQVKMIKLWVCPKFLQRIWKGLHSKGLWTESCENGTFCTTAVALLRSFIAQLDCLLVFFQSVLDLIDLRIGIILNYNFLNVGKKFPTQLS